jgi:hypothetical protein
MQDLRSILELTPASPRGFWETKDTDVNIKFIVPDNVSIINVSDLGVSCLLPESGKVM